MLGNFFKKLRYYKGTNLNADMIKALQRDLQKELDLEFNAKHRLTIQKASKKLNQFYKQRLTAQKKGVLSLAEFENLQQLKSLNRKKDKPKTIQELKAIIYKQRDKKNKLIGKKLTNLDKLGNKAYKGLLKERLGSLSRQVKADSRKAQIYKQISTALENRLLPLTDKEITALQEAVNKREYSKKQTEAFINNQQHILQSALDTQLNLDNDAIGIHWITCDDERVVGNPYGMYPQPTREHGDHYARHNQIIFYKSSSAVAKGYIAKSNVSFYEDLKDGGFSAHNCLAKGQSFDFSNFPNNIFKTNTTNIFPFYQVSFAGQTLLVTGGHKMLTRNGWVTADSINKGDKILQIVSEVGNVVEKNFNYNTPAIDNIFDLLFKTISAFNVELFNGLRLYDTTSSLMNFDKYIRRNENISVVYIDRFLECGVDFICYQGVKNINFTSTDKMQFFINTISEFFSCLRSHNFFIDSFNTPPSSNMSFFSDFHYIFFTTISKADKISLTARADFISKLFEISNYTSPRNSEIFTHFKNAVASDVSIFKLFCVYFYIVIWHSFSMAKSSILYNSTSDSPVDFPSIDAKLPADLSDRKVFADTIIDDIKLVNCESHIYSLETSFGYYTTKNIISKNCRCFGIAIHSLDELDDIYLTKKGIKARDKLA